MREARKRRQVQRRHSVCARGKQRVFVVVHDADVWPRVELDEFAAPLADVGAELYGERVVAGWQHADTASCEEALEHVDGHARDDVRRCRGVLGGDA